MKHLLASLAALAPLTRLLPAPGAAPASNGIVLLQTNNAIATTNDTLRDIVGPIPVGIGWTWLARTLLALALLAVGAWLWHARRRRKETGTPATPAPDEKARQRLRDLLQLVNQPRPFCFAASEIIRTYLEDRFRLRAPDQTTEEFLDDLRDHPRLASRHQQLLADFLTRCDLVKFARHEPGRPEIEDLHNAALKIVDETTSPTADPGLTPPPPLLDPPAQPPPLTGSTPDGPTVPAPAPVGDQRYMPRPRGPQPPENREVTS